MPVPNESSERKLRTRRREAQLTLIKMPALSRSAKPKLVAGGRPALHEEAARANEGDFHKISAADIAAFCQFIRIYTSGTQIRLFFPAPCARLRNFHEGVVLGLGLKMARIDEQGGRRIYCLSILANGPANRARAVGTDSRGRERSALRSRSPGSSGSSGNLCPQPARHADAISFVRKQRECEKTECRAAEQVPRFPEADRRRRRQWRVETVQRWWWWRRAQGSAALLRKPRARTTVTTTASPPLPPSSSPRMRANHIERTCRN
ncbi:hypothetical protein ALC57_07280 [Trachymyrmex cornetzi]|uniref:Uncharacterized protein n=1 Tax=Trachymyrmex cornetzi TaxID=471704 RepID=A0A195E5B0_9HYME|nr:hypothetical protein ALC57_07280 [Trachymyrmex cornetzi]